MQQICLYIHDPREPHLHALKCILRYVKGTLDHGLQLHVSPSSDLIAYSDADWGGCPVSRPSTLGYCVFLGDNLISWSLKRRGIISQSSAKEKYRGVANFVAETCWVCNLLWEMRCHHRKLPSSIVTTSTQSTCPQTQFNINVLKILRSKFALCMIWLQVG